MKYTKILLTMILMLMAFTVCAQDMIDNTATTMMLMQPAMTDSPHPAAKNSKPPADEGYVTDEVTMPDGSKAFLKHKKTTPVQPVSNVTVDRVSKFDSQAASSDGWKNVYVYPITVKGVPCVAVTAGYQGNTSIALSCGWKQ